MSSRTLTVHDYTVAWLCALDVELAAAIAGLDEQHSDLPSVDGDSNTYVYGSIGIHNVVLACLPSGTYGTTPASVAATNLRRTFRGIRLSLLVGVGGGAPGPPNADSRKDIRLGDVVVCNPDGVDGKLLACV